MPTRVTTAGSVPVPSPQFTVAETPDPVSSGLGSVKVARTTVPVLVFSTAETGNVAALVSAGRPPWPCWRADRCAVDVVDHDARREGAGLA